MKLNEVCDVYSGYALKNFNNDKNGIPVIKIGNIIQNLKLDLSNCEYTTDSVKDKFFSKKNDIYVALSGATTGKIGMMTENDTHIINQRVGIVRSKINSFPVKYLKWFLQYHSNRILSDAAGAAQPNISPKQIENYELKDITDSERTKISQNLDNISDEIDNKLSILNSLDELVKSRFMRQEVIA